MTDDDLQRTAVHLVDEVVRELRIPVPISRDVAQASWKCRDPQKAKRLKEFVEEEWRRRLPLLAGALKPRSELQHLVQVKVVASGADAVPREASILRQKNRLADLKEELAKAERAASLADQAYKATETALTKIRETERRARDRARTADTAHGAAVQRQANILRQAADQSAKLEGLRSSIERFGDDLVAYETRSGDKQAEH